jgi:hypothetical protein
VGGEKFRLDPLSRFSLCTASIVHEHVLIPTHSPYNKVLKSSILFTIRFYLKNWGIIGPIELISNTPAERDLP